MDPAALLAAITAAHGVFGAVETVIKDFNTLVGGVIDVKKKLRWLKIRIVNMSVSQQHLVVGKTWFEHGRCWDQPFPPIIPGSAITFFVCNKDGEPTGVEGGMSVEASENDGKPLEEDPTAKWICTFSNPLVGSYKSSTSFTHLTIQDLFQGMKNDKMVRESHCGCYRTEDNTIVFVWKDSDCDWGSLSQS